jgi:hypothetical protein
VTGSSESQEQTEMISSEVVTQTWQRMCQAPIHRAPELVERMNEEHTRFSDNYYDLAAGERRTIVATNQTTPLTPAMVSMGWH